MNKKTKRIIAIIALVFMALFSVALILTFYDRTLFNGAIGACALFTGGVGIALFLVIKLSRSPEDSVESGEETPGDGEDADGEKRD